MTDDHWLKLGDTAVSDDEGFLALTGYPKDMITLATGETINPTSIEDTVRMELPCVSHCLLVGEGQSSLGLLMTLDTIVDTEQGLPTQQLTLSAQKWFKAARFDVKTVSDVTKKMEGGIKHVIQVGQRLFIRLLFSFIFRPALTEPMKRLPKLAISSCHGISSLYPSHLLLER